MQATQLRALLVRKPILCFDAHPCTEPHTKAGVKQTPLFGQQQTRPEQFVIQEKQELQLSNGIDIRCGPVSLSTKCLSAKKSTLQRGRRWFGLLGLITRAPRNRYASTSAKSPAWLQPKERQDLQSRERAAAWLCSSERYMGGKPVTRAKPAECPR